MKKILAWGIILIMLPLSNALAEQCQADLDCNTKVDLSDLVIMKQEFLNTGCFPCCNVCVPEPTSALVPNTGQIMCYDTDGNQRDCAGTGEDGEYQTGVSYPNPRFTDNLDGTVTDNLTGLIWTKDAQQIPGLITWQGALDACNNLVYAGHNDWKLPNVRELQSLIDYGRHDPALPPGHPFINLVSGDNWSSTDDVYEPQLAWTVRFAIGYVLYYYKSGGSHYAWCCRGIQ